MCVLGWVSVCVLERAPGTYRPYPGHHLHKAGDYTYSILPLHTLTISGTESRNNPSGHGHCTVQSASRVQIKSVHMFTTCEQSPKIIRLHVFSV